MNSYNTLSYYVSSFLIIFWFLIFQAPWSAAIWVRNSTTREYKHHCGGSIITENHILTAAHCVDQRILPDISDVISDLKVIVGMRNPGRNCSRKVAVEYQIKKVSIHPKFNFPYFDVSILELKSKLQYTKGIAAICLSNVPTDSLTGHSASLFGWGARDHNGIPSKVLLGTHQLKVTSIRQCRNKINFFTYDNDHYISVFGRDSWLKTNSTTRQKSMEALICVKDNEPDGLVGSCGGDSGSAVVTEAFGFNRVLTFEQFGIVSGGRCSSRNSPSVLTHVGHQEVLSFIKKESKLPVTYQIFVVVEYYTSMHFLFFVPNYP